MVVGAGLAGLTTAVFLGDGTPVSPCELLGAHFLVLTGAAGMVRADPAVFAGLGVDSVIQKVGPEALADPDGEWAAACGLGPAGTVLVRPDGVIAWRSRGPAGAGELDKALRTVLAR